MEESAPGPGPWPGSKMRVFWSDVEKYRMVKHAADLQAADPRLGGLPLFRAAIEALPPNRRRRVVAMSQAPWFARMLDEEIRHRELEEKLAGDLLPVAIEHGKTFKESQRILEETRQISREAARRNTEWNGMQLKWRDLQISKLDEANRRLERIEHLLERIAAKR